MTYFAHLRFSLSLAWLLFSTAFYALVHAFFPMVFKRKASHGVAEAERRLFTPNEDDLEYWWL